MDAKELLESLKKDLIFYNDSIKEISNEILQNEMSRFPIFVAHQLEIKIGEVILNKDDFGTDWTINASIVEEFIEHGIISKDKEDEFAEIYKDPEKFMCVFLISEKGGNFIFHPYK